MLLRLLGLLAEQDINKHVGCMVNNLGLSSHIYIVGVFHIIKATGLRGLQLRSRSRNRDYLLFHFQAPLHPLQANPGPRC